MLKILIIDDDVIKSEKVRSTIASGLNAPVRLEVARTVKEATTLMNEVQYDLAIIDLFIPLDEVSELSKGGGIAVLDAIEKSKRIKSPRHVVGLSSFSEMVEQQRPRFEEGLRHLIEYSPSSVEWSKKLVAFVVNIDNSESEGYRPSYDYDMAIVCALQKPELDAVLSLPGGWKKVPKDNKSSFDFWEGSFGSESSPFRVVCGASPRMGMPMSTALSCAIIQRFTPRYLVIGGIAAGVSGNFGDILIADRTWDYGSGKSRSVENASGGFDSEFEPDPFQLNTDDELLRMLQVFKSKSDEVLFRIRNNWLGPKPEKLECRMGVTGITSV